MDRLLISCIVKFQVSNLHMMNKNQKSIIQFKQKNLHDTVLVNVFCDKKFHHTGQQHFSKQQD